MKRLQFTGKGGLAGVYFESTTVQAPGRREDSPPFRSGHPRHWHRVIAPASPHHYSSDSQLRSIVRVRPTVLLPFSDSFVLK